MEENSLLVDFFRLLFGETLGWLCIATESSVRGDFRQRYFQWPLQESELLTYINREKSKKNVWFGVNLFDRKERLKESCIPGSILWADLDSCPPDDIEPKPQIVIESSSGRYQALWKLNEDIDPEIAEDYSRRIYGRYKQNGVDSGWALTKLLRVPFTYNFKQAYQKPQVKLIRAVAREPLDVTILDELSFVLTTPEDKLEDESIPELLDHEEVIARHRNRLEERGFARIWKIDPVKGERSQRLWNLICICLESGLTKEETYAIAYNSTVNKYRLDNRPERYLWREVQKASLQLTNFTVLADSIPFEMPELIPGDRYKLGSSLVERYIRWAKVVTDAVPRYHELTVFVVLSCLLAGNLRLDTSFGTIHPNLWGLVLGETSLCRKTTAMRLGVDILEFIDKDVLLGTDGSSEGIVKELANRPGRTSLFYRDEIVGLMDSMRDKKYQAGMPQLFTQLYDGTSVRRVLAKDTVYAEQPVFIFFGGGITDQFYTSVSEDFIYSGFLPRFLIVAGMTDKSRLRRLGPPTQESSEEKQHIYAKMHELYHNYMSEVDVQIAGQPALEPAPTVALLTSDAYNLYGDINDRLLEAAEKSPNPSLAIPTFERLCISLLKMAMLSAATRQEPNDFQIEVTDLDIRRASKYVQEWGWDTIDVISNVGQTVAMKIIDKAHRYVMTHPETTRSTMLRAMNLTKRQIMEIEETLEARGHMRVIPEGRGRRYQAIN